MKYYVKPLTTSENSPPSNLTWFQSRKLLSTRNVQEICLPLTSVMVYEEINKDFVSNGDGESYL